MLKEFRLVLLFLLPLVFLLPTLNYLSNNLLILYPNEKYFQQYQTFKSGEYKIEDFYFDNKTMNFHFRPKDGPGTPYASLVVWLDDEGKHYDLSSYDYLEIDVANSTYRDVVIFLKTYLDGISKPKREDAIYLRHNEYTLLHQAAGKYKIPLQKFTTPDWWYEMLKVPTGLRQTENFKKTVAIDFQFIDRHTHPVKEQSETFILNKLAFHKTYPLLALILACLAGACYLGLVLYWLIIRGKRITQPDLSYNPLPITNYQDDALARINDYIKTHYNDPQISTSQIGKATGISKSHVIEFIKKEYHDTCKQVINKIRITEAQRLLKATDRRITEIALELGFNDITTFNRSFKKQTGKSPRTYRTSS